MDLYMVLMEFLSSVKFNGNLPSKLAIPTFKGTSC